MLETLHISNYALIDNIDIVFHEGLNIITGETGAGKSIMLGALSLIMGSRADTRVLRSSDKKTVIEATFTVDDHPRLKVWCADNDIDWDDKRCILRREIAPSGRSRAFVNDTPVPLAVLRDIAMLLVDIHSQHQNLLLARPEFQVEIIDTLAENGDMRAEHSKRWNTFKSALQRLKTARANQRKSKDDEEYTRYQLEQLEDLKIAGPEEQTELEQRKEILENINSLKSAINIALEALSGPASNAIDLIDQAREACTTLKPILDENESIPERLDSASIELKDISDTLEGINDDLTADPEELMEIERRLDLMYSLEQKHHVDSLAALIDLRDKLRKKLADLDDSDNILGELEKEARRTLSLAKETAAALTQSRIESAKVFAEELVNRARPLGMHNLRCDVEVSQAELGVSGADNVVFMFAFNKNQPLLPVGTAASGGEISRLMLSIKSIVARRMELPSIIFDEVDTGVSGDVANRMGSMMREIGDSIQVIAITHLPQVAAMGAHHFKVYKQDDDEATHTRITPLTDEQRIDEIAIMLSGDRSDSDARAAAQKLLSRRRKQ